MTKHDKPLTPHDEEVLEDLAEIERTGVVNQHDQVAHMDVDAIARAAGGPSVSGAMMDATGIGARAAGGVPDYDPRDHKAAEGYGGPDRADADDEAQRAKLPKIDTSEK
jgi:hypothetical protein